MLKPGILCLFGRGIVTLIVNPGISQSLGIKPGTQLFGLIVPSSLYVRGLLTRLPGEYLNKQKLVLVNIGFNGCEQSQNVSGECLGVGFRIKFCHIPQDYALSGQNQQQTAHTSPEISSFELRR